MKYDDRKNQPVATTAHPLMVSCPNDGGLIALGPEGPVILDFYDTIGLHADDRYFVRAYQTYTGAHLDIFDGDRHHSLFIPEVIDMHDIFVDGETLYAASTGTNEIIACDLQGRLQERISFPGGTDSHHLNCIGRIGGRLVISAFGQFTEYRGWSEGRSQDQGFVIDLRDLRAERPLLSGLDQPHTPREHAGWLYICDSRANRLHRECAGNCQQLDFPGWFVRGLAFADDTLYAGLSTSRNNLTDQLKGRIAVIDLPSFTVREYITLPFAEVYDIALVTPDRQALLKAHYANPASAWQGALQSVTTCELDFHQACHTAQVFWSQDAGFDQARSIRRRYATGHEAILNFELPATEGMIRIRIDPVEDVGEFLLNDLRVEDAATGRVVWQFDHSTAAVRKIKFSSDVRHLYFGPRPRFISLGTDPYLILPPIPHSGALRVKANLGFTPGLGDFLKHQRAMGAMLRLAQFFGDRLAGFKTRSMS
ncbi:MAG: DUF4915 domain-containing protein [Opitutaceae bacterium]